MPTLFVPVPTETSKPFWDGLADERVLIPRCDNCQAWVWYPRIRCPQCMSDRLTWTPVSGAATLHSFSVTYRAYGVGPVTDGPPTIVAIVALAEGPHLTSDLVHVDPAACTVGMALQPEFDHQDGITYLRFRPAP